MTAATAPWHTYYPDGVKPQIDEIPYASLGAMVADTARRYGNAPAFSNLGHTLTFAEVDRLSDRVAANLIALGLEPSDRVALQLPNLLQYPVALFGILKAGLIGVNLNPFYTEGEIRRILADAQPRAFIVLSTFADKIDHILPETTVEHVIVTRPGDLLPQPKRTVVNFAAKWIKKIEPDYDIPDRIGFRKLLDAAAPAVINGVSPEDIALLQYTGGTTGGAKAAVLTHRNLLSNQAQFLGLMKVAFSEPNPTVIAALPMYHVFSLTVNCFGFFGLGAHNVLITDPRDIPAFVKTLRDTQPHGIVLVSTLAGALTDSEEFRALTFPRLKLNIAGGMAVRTSVAQTWQEITGTPLTEGYGLTEASPVVTVNPPHLPPRIGTIGVPLPSTEVKLLDDDGNEVAEGRSGELAVRGPQVMREYWGHPDLTAECLTEDGWLLTGDIAEMEDGYLTIVDRKKEIIVVGGFNVYPGEIEDVAMMHPGVALAGVIGVPDAHSGEVPKLFVVRRDPHLTEERLREYLATELTNYKRPRQIVFRDELPTTTVGKVLRRKLKDA